MCLLTNFATDVKLGVLTQAAASSQMYEIIAKAFDFPTYEEVHPRDKVSLAHLLQELLRLAGAPGTVCLIV